MRLTILFAICTLNLIYAKVPSGYVDPSNIKKYDRGRYSSFRQSDVDENPLEIQQINCECDSKDCKHYEDDVSSLHSYHKRLVNRLINVLQVNGNNYLLKLNTEIIEEQFQILKNYGQSKELNYDSLRQVDDLISDILYEAQSTSMYDNISGNWIQYLKLFFTTQNIIILAVTAVAYMTYRLIHIRFSILRAISLFIFVFLIIGFGWTWHDLVEEEEIKLMAQRMQYPIPPECNAAEMTWWQRMFTSKSSVDCEKFVRAHNKKATLSITPQKVFSEMFGQSISHLLGHFIGSMVEFITKMHESLPFPFNYLSVPFLLLFVLLMIVLLVIILSGVHLKFGILSLFNVEIGSSSNRMSPHLRRHAIDEHREYLQQIPQQKVLLEPVNIGDDMQIQDRRPRLEANVNGLQVDRKQIQELALPSEPFDNSLQVQRVETQEKNMNFKNDRSENSGNIITKTESASCQTELINSTTKTQQSKDYCENNKIDDNILIEDIHNENSSGKNDDKSQSDDSLTNSLNLETTKTKLEVDNEDTNN